MSDKIVRYIDCYVNEHPMRHSQEEYAMLRTLAHYANDNGELLMQDVKHPEEENPDEQRWYVYQFNLPALGAA
jgi:hypothetical protein